MIFQIFFLSVAFALLRRTQAEELRSVAAQRNFVFDAERGLHGKHGKRRHDAQAGRTADGKKRRAKRSKVRGEQEESGREGERAAGAGKGTVRRQRPGREKARGTTVSCNEEEVV